MTTNQWPQSHDSTPQHSSADTPTSSDCAVMYSFVTLTASNALEVDGLLAENGQLGVIVADDRVLSEDYLARLRREGRPVLTAWNPIPTRRPSTTFIRVMVALALWATVFAAMVPPIHHAVLPQWGSGGVA